MKIKKIQKFFVLLSIVMVAISCGKGLLFIDDSNGLDGKEGKLVISGIVLDHENCRPLEGIQVSFQCDANNFEKITCYTNNDGIFLIKAQGFTTEITGCLTARDLNNNYSPLTRDIRVNWKGESYDSKTGLFAINDCNFMLRKR